jgi:PAS domain S-box-containing protein
MKNITFLLVDDNPDDRTLAQRELKREFGEITVIEALENEQFQEFLVKKQFDIVITDYFLQWSNGLEILKAVKKQDPECPVIMFTGTGNEEIAVEAMKEGLDDYVIKSPKHYLRMAKATRSAYERYRQRQALKEVESQYYRLFESVPVGLYRISKDGTFLEANLALLEILGYPNRETIKQANLFTDHFPSSALQAIQNQSDQQQPTQNLELRLSRCCNNGKIWVRYSARSVYDEQENFLYNEGIIEDITQRKEAEAQVSQLLEKEQQAREEAEAANRLKDEFLATLSHELRTPLNSILGWAQMLQRGTLSQKQTTKALSIIERNVRDQTKLVEDLLDVSRIVRGKMKLDLRLVDLYQVVNEALNMVRPTAEAKSIQLQILPPEPEILRINGDVDRLRQIIWNLLINAIKFTPNKGKVTVRLEQVEEMVMVHVTDTGIGIESDILPHVFDRFRQVDSSSRRRHGGLGIGLAIVRHLTELHGGSVTATSEGQDQGSTFSVKLPAAITQESEVNSPVVESATNLPQIAGIRVLVVDDEPDTLQLTTMILEEYEVQVTAVESVAQALQALETQTFDLMISDISMPEADGYDLIKSVRTSYPQMSAIALTAFASDRDRTTALETGFDLYLAKPIDADQLVEAVEELVKQ